jgi:hypothetical protein
MKMQTNLASSSPNMLHQAQWIGLRGSAEVAVLANAVTFNSGRNVLVTVHFDGKTGKTTCYFVGENVDNP